MRAATIVLLAPSLLIACTDKSEPADSGAASDTTGQVTGDDTDEETDEDTGAEVTDPTDNTAIEPVEDCTDGADNDGDGLADCEDDDCVDFCMEDCTDGIDNDGDGAIDCDDDECFADPICPTIYDMELRPRFEAFGWADGPRIESMLGYPAVAMLYGYVEVVGTPRDADVEGFLCEGRLLAGSYSGGYYPHALTLDSGDCDGCDLHVVWEATVENGGLTWDDGSCPLPGLPAVNLGLQWKEIYLTSRTEGAWAPRYYTTFYGYETYFPGTDREYRVQQLYNLRPMTPATWSAPYEPPAQ